MASVSKSKEAFTAGIIVIGDEILKGQTADTNSTFLTKKLYNLGVKVKKVSVIPDELEAISQEVKCFSEKYAYVITSGGIGPTHDDKTFEGVAKAFNVNLIKNSEIEKICNDYFGQVSDSPLKLSHIPESARLIYGFDKVNQKNLLFPLITINNVYMFPGIPQLMEMSFESLEDLFRNPADNRFIGEVYINLSEYAITHIIDQAFQLFGKQVSIGSYPAMHNNYYKVCLALESSDPKSFEECKSFFTERLQPHICPHYDKNPLSDMASKVYQWCDNLPPSDTFKPKLRHSIRVLERLLERFSVGTFCVGFNGGKDCTALLHLVAAVMHKQLKASKAIDCLYLRRGQPFPEVEHFMKETIARYNTHMHTASGSIKDALADFKHNNPVFDCVVMGTRTTDPHSAHLEDFHPTDEGWPQMMRVSPLLAWSYSDIWRFIRHLNLPYCSLYDVGYTSLGSMENTHPNPSLCTTDASGNTSYSPAFFLEDHHLERAGRNV